MFIIKGEIKASGTYSDLNDKLDLAAILHQNHPAEVTEQNTVFSGLQGAIKHQHCEVTPNSVSAMAQVGNLLFIQGMISNSLP